MSLPSSTALRTTASLYTEHHPWLCGWLMRRLGNVADAGDLAQDTFVRVLCAPAAQTSALRAPRAYLATVARRLLINHLRRATLEEAYRETLACLSPTEAPSAETQAALWQALQALDALLQSLPPKPREVFVLAEVEGLTYAEIAEHMGVGLRSVKRYAAQALAHCALMQAP